MTTRSPLRIILLLLTLIMAAAVPRSANAHASLVSADPADGAMVAEAPQRIALTFNEPVSPRVLRLIDPAGRITPLDLAPARGNTLEIALPRLATGTHLLSWRVISADGHPVGGTLTFSVGRITAAPDGQTNASWPVRAAIIATRIAIYFGLFIGIGGAAFSAWIAPLPRPARRIAEGVAVAAAGAAVFSIGLQGLDVLAASPSDIASVTTWRAGFDTSYALTASIAGTALLAVPAAFRARPPMQHLWATMALLGLGLALAVSGHASNASPQWLMRPAVFIHAVCIALWIGALIPLYRLMRGDTTPAPALGVFSRAIPLVVAALIAAGVTLAVVQVEHWNALWNTTYGLILVAKLALVAALFALAVLNRLVLAPAVMRDHMDARLLARRRLARSVLAEIVLASLILTLVAFWRFTPPPRALAASEPAFVHLHDRRAMADVTLMPGRAGPLTATARLMQEDFTPLPAREVVFTLSNPEAGIEPISRPGTLADQVWRAEGIVIPLAGRWEVRIEVLVSDFDKIVLDGPLLIQP